MGKYKQTFELITYLALAGNVLRVYFSCGKTQNKVSD